MTPPLLGVALLLVLVSAASSSSPPDGAAAADGDAPISTWSTTVAAPPGSPCIEVGDVVTVNALGRVQGEDGKEFWSTKSAGQTAYTYTAGVGSVIKGWDRGCLGAQIGETRLIYIPSAEGYGASGFPAWGISGGDDLIFEIEVLAIEGKQGGEVEEPPGIDSDADAATGGAPNSEL